MSHGDYIETPPDGFRVTAKTIACPVAAMEHGEKTLCAPISSEVNHTEHGISMLRNFLYQVCNAKGDWTMGDYCRDTIKAVREKVGSGKVLLASPAA